MSVSEAMSMQVVGLLGGFVTAPSLLLQKGLLDLVCQHFLPSANSRQYGRRGRKQNIFVHAPLVPVLVTEHLLQPSNQVEHPLGILGLAG